MRGTTVEEFERFASLLIDGYFVVDRQRRIVSCNQAFRVMFPRSVARKLVGRPYHEVLDLSLGQERCVVEQCWASGRSVRLDQVRGRVEGSPEERHFILSAMPLHDSGGALEGAAVLQRDISDDVAVQVKYRKQSEDGDMRLGELEGLLRERSRRLIEQQRKIEQLRLELFRTKTELIP